MLFLCLLYHTQAYTMLDNNKFKITLINTDAKKLNINYYGLMCWNNLSIHILQYTYNHIIV